MSLSHQIATDGFIHLPDHPTLRRSVEREVRQGRLSKVLPGVYSTDPAAMTTAQQIAAVCCWDPDAVVGGDAALQALVEPTRTVGAIAVASPHRHRSQPGFAFTHRLLPPELVLHRSGVRLARPAMAAIELAATDDGDAIDTVLRRRAATLDQMRTALRSTARAGGNRRRTEVLLDSRDEPWSQAERQAHRLLRGAGIVGWCSNRAISIADDTYYGDIVFEAERVVLEVDGFETHGTRVAFEHDRRRQNQLQLDGWLVLRVTWAMLTEASELVLGWVRSALLVRGGGGF